MIKKQKIKKNVNQTIQSNAHFQCQLVFQSDRHISTVCRSAYAISRASTLTASIRLLKQPNSSVPLFSQNQTAVILFYLTAHFTFSADHRKFRTHREIRLSKHSNMIMCNISCKHFTGYRSKPE